MMMDHGTSNSTLLGTYLHTHPVGRYLWELYRFDFGFSLPCHQGLAFN